ncbi:MAG: hypothetical protein PHU21_00650 [Elusimicrobia bacterium]|nr:hypothetical protein [Elusimicrobiota bacterium]
MKKAISIPADLHDMVCEVSRTQHQPYSAVVRTALDRYFERLRLSEMERAYRSYYGQEKAREADAKLGGEVWRESQSAWPDRE